MRIRAIERKIVIFVVILILGVTTIMAQYNKEYFLWMGRQMMIEGEYRNAISLLNTLIGRDKKEYEGYFLRGIAKYNMGDLLGADADLTLALEYNPVYTTAYTYRAITRSRLGNYDDALKDFAEAIELRPDLPEPYYSRGVTQLLNQQFDLAIEDFSQFISMNNRVSDAYINRGICHLQLRDTLRAYDDFNTAIKTNYHSPEGYNRRGTLRLQQNMLAEAKSDFDRAIENDSTHISSYFNRAITMNNLHKPEAALDDLDRVIRLDSLSSLSYFNRAIILSQVGDYNKALEDFDEVADLSPDNVLVYFYRANLLTRLGEIEAAEDDYSRAIELYPDFANAYLYRSNLRYILRNPEGAKRDKELADRKIAEHRSKLQDSTYSIYSDSTYKFDKLLSFDTKLSGSSFEARHSGGNRGGELDLIPMFKFTLIEPDTTKIRHSDYYDRSLEDFIQSADNQQLVISHKATNLTKESLERVEKELRADQKNEENSYVVDFELGVAQSLIKQYTTSLESLTEAIEQKPESPYAYINRAVTRAEMIEFISSIESSFQRITIDSDPARKLNTTKRNYDYDAVVADLEEAIRLHPRLAYNHYNLGCILVIQGKLPEAYNAFSEAIKLYANFGEAYFNRAIVQIMMEDTRKGCIDLSKSGELGVDRAYELLDRYSQME